jgi:hypothetical protein
MDYPEIPATSDDDIVREARMRLELAIEWESSNRTDALTDFEFRNGDQWPVDIRRDRETDARPCITVNLTDAMVRRVSNACRENRPRIKVDPVDQATTDTAKVYNGIIRHVENISGADYAYDTGVDCAITGGLGYIGVTTDYIDFDSMDQEIKIEAHRNPFRIYFDPASQMPDGSDAQWVIESDFMRRDEYRMKYGQLDPSGWTFLGAGDNVANWSNKEEIRVAKYWRIEHKKDKVVRLSNKQTMLKSKFDKGAFGRAGVVVVDERDTIVPTVKWYLCTATKILTSGTWPGRYIPIVPVYGRMLDVNGKVKLKGMVRDLRDPARMFNYSETAKTEAYALQPRAPWLGPEGFMDGHEAAWRDANRKSIVGLEYTPTKNVDGTPNPPPMRQNPPPLGAGFQEWSASNQSNFMAVAGMPHDPNMDKQGEVVSGVALRQRQGLADIAHFDFYDNLTRSLRHLGKIIVDLIPHIYDTERMQRIVMPDGRSQMVAINQKQKDPVTGAILAVKNDLTVGRYDVTMDTGPGYKTARQESTEAKLELLATPLGEMTGKVAGDLIVRGMDWEGADEIADRLQAAIPGAQTDPNSDLPPKAQMMIAQLQGQLKQANQQAMAFELELKSKHQLEHIKQEGETKRTQMEIGAKVHDTTLKTATARFDTHVKSITARDVAEINTAGKILGQHVGHAQNKEMSAIDHAEAKDLQASEPKPTSSPA